MPALPWGLARFYPLLEAPMRFLSPGGPLSVAALLSNQV